MESQDLPASTALPSAPSPGRHLLTLIVDALQLPAPAGTVTDQAAYLALVERRAAAVLNACRQALAATGEGGTLYAARDLFDAVSGLPVTYQCARTGPGGQRIPAGESMST